MINICFDITWIRKVARKKGTKRQRECPCLLRHLVTLRVVNNNWIPEWKTQKKRWKKRLLFYCLWSMIIDRSLFCNNSKERKKSAIIYTKWKILTCFADSSFFPSQWGKMVRTFLVTHYHNPFPFSFLFFSFSLFVSYTLASDQCNVNDLLAALTNCKLWNHCKRNPKTWK